MLCLQQRSVVVHVFELMHALTFTNFAIHICVLSLLQLQQDEIYKTTADVTVAAAADHYLVNGCDDFGMKIVAGEWTRLRMLHNSHSKNGVVRFVDKKLKAAKCELNLFALDGVYLST
jgi:hypothetical protein